MCSVVVEIHQWLQIALKDGGIDTEVTQDDVDEYLQLLATYHVKYDNNCETTPETAPGTF